MRHFDWSEYKDFADLILKVDLAGVSEETKIRNACSRLYYFCFHCLKNKLVQDNVIDRNVKGGVHGAIQSHLFKTNRNLAQNFREARTIREECDYNACIQIEKKLEQMKRAILPIVCRYNSYSRPKDETRNPV